MAQARDGDTVKVHYTGKLKDGTVFDSSVDRAPLEFKLGEGQIIPGFERMVRGMAVGESKSSDIPVEDAYGPRHQEMVMQVGHEHFPPDLKPEVGQQLEMEREDGQVLRVTITDVAEEGVTIDANHPLAGETLTFDVEVVGID
jgi:FKBP-type peptidyl-prolyl cis-trans isomerase 2